MTDYALLNNVEHQDVKVITERSARYGDDIMLAMAFTFEFRNVQAHYPILFQQDAQGGFQPVALFGFSQGENLFLGEDGWQAPYIPAMVKREPFLIGFGNSTSGASERTRMLSLDMAHPRVSTEVGEPLFQPLGGRTEFLEDAANLLETIYTGIDHTKAFCTALAEHDLIEAVTFEIELKDASRNQLVGFHCIAEEKLQALSGDTLAAFNESGYLMPTFMALASLAHVQDLVERKNRTLDLAGLPK
ncbi:MAG: SapC family protein [Gammaproteobacteria bacterium]|nr:SapC family protein [Gammaproteobacteria bacterium]